MQPNSMQDIISSAASGGWDWFEKADPSIRKALDVQQERASADAQAVSAAWARFYLSPDGQKALETLFNTTLRRTVFFAALGLDPMSMAVFGAMREGQNAVAHEIARQIGLGMNEAVKPRDT
jgi:expansin (peptidoglycan-binding protein)